MLLISATDVYNEFANRWKYQELQEINSMIKTNTVLRQMQALFPRYEFEKLVNEHSGDKGIRHFSTWNLLQVLFIAHLTAQKSIRNICDSLQSKANYWYHLGLNSISRNNLSHALMNRPDEIFRDAFFTFLFKIQSERGIKRDKRFKFKNPLKSIDSTLVSLCITMYSWANYRETKGGIRLHFAFDNKNQVPDFLVIREGREHDINEAYSIPIAANSIYVLDRGYFCYDFLHKINENEAFFVTRTKSNTLYRVVKRNSKDGESIKADWIITVTGQKSDDYPENLRIVKYYDSETKRTFEFITNNFALSAKTIADIYKSRWDIELFFKWIKQNLKIKSFLGTSENAVKIQIWSAMLLYLLIEYIRYVSRTPFPLLKVFRLLKDNAFLDYNILDLLLDRIRKKYEHPIFDENQLVFGF